MQMPLHEAFALAHSHEASGQRAQARRIYDQILAAVADHPGALYKIAEQDLAEGLADSARERVQRALRAARLYSLPTTDLWRLLARVELARGARDAASDAYREALEGARDAGPIHEQLGHLALESGHASEAERHFRKSLATGDGAPSRVAGLALSLAQQDRFRDALDALGGVEEKAGPSAEIARALAWITLRSGDATTALEMCGRALAKHPNDVELLHLRGQALKALGAYVEAREVLERATRLAPGDARLCVTLGAVCLDLGAVGAALLLLTQAVELGSTTAETWDNLGMARWGLGNLSGALEAFRAAIAADDRLSPALANCLNALQHACLWDELETLQARLQDTLTNPAADPRFPPFVALTLEVAPQARLTLARRWSQRVLPAVAERPQRRTVPTKKGSRLRVGYLSSDFRTHPMAHLIAGLFERIDARRFESFAYSHGPDDGSAIRARIANAFGHWRDVNGSSDRAIADLIRSDGIDVLVDLNGHTHGSRLAVLSHRPAPVQLHYLGYPGTLGFDGIDALVADEWVVPAGDEAAYHEAILRMPRCYFVTNADRDRPVPAPRASLGLREDALVLASFNQPYKLSRRFFHVWLEALASTSRAVLWLLAPDALTRRNLMVEASRAAIDPSRIVFAEKLGQEAHLARLPAADLALDLLPCGSHTTGVDALWSGVPMLTCAGDGFAGRVGASLLHAVGMDELVTSTFEEYRETLLALVLDQARIRSLRARLAANAPDAELFDTAGFARDWECLLLSAYERV